MIYFAGGLGGRPGESIFLMIGDKPTNAYPKINAEFGTIGKNGKNPKPCKNTAVDILIYTKQNEILFVSWFKSKFFIEKIPDPKCNPDVIVVNNTIEIPKPSSRKIFDVASAALHCKAFLLTKVMKPSLVEIIRQTFDAIDSKCNVCGTERSGG